MELSMSVIKKQYCPSCGDIVVRDGESCKYCGFLLIDETTSVEPKKEELHPRILKLKVNKAANFSILFTVLAAILYAIPFPWISIAGGTPLSLIAIILAIIGMFNPYMKTRKIIALIIAFLAPAVWLTQFWFTGYYWI